MHLVASSSTRGEFANTAPATQAVSVRGVLGWVLDAVGALTVGSRGPGRRQMEVVETLALGAKKQLILVSCDGERFLVGTGPESVQTIVRVRSEAALGAMPGDAKEWSR